MFINPHGIKHSLSDSPLIASAPPLAAFGGMAAREEYVVFDIAYFKAMVLNIKDNVGSIVNISLYLLVVIISIYLIVEIFRGFAR